VVPKIRLTRKKYKFYTLSPPRKNRGNKSDYYIQIAVLALIFTILCLKVANYAHLSFNSPAHWAGNLSEMYKDEKYDISELKYFGKCPKGELKIDIGRDYLCRQQTKPSLYQKIYDTYPRNPNGDEDIYASYMDTYSLKTANDFLKDQYDVQRYKPAIFKGPLTWREDPYHDRFWRYNFYSLRIFKDLLNANIATGNQEYSNKLVSIVNSFLKAGVKQPHAWDDYHAVAWRALALTDVWWKLRQHNELPIQTSNAILASLEQHGMFMLQSDHFQPEFNHAVNEAAALYELGVAFPTLPHAAEWRAVGAERLSNTLTNLIDSNGALTEHSSYYDFYVLSKFWDIDKYSDDYKYSISNQFDAKIAEMTNYATYILQPNLHVPLIGASLDEQVGYQGDYKQIAQKYPEFKYVLTQGREGKKPSHDNIQFKDTGETVMRSSWSGGSNYSNQTQVIFTYGAYETSHSNLDSLGFMLYSNGIEMLPGPGLYSYTPGSLHNYFHGTESENTVLVDGKDQSEGTGVAGKFIQGNGYVSQSAADQLNSGVTQERQLTLIGSSTLVIVDKLHSSNTHTYQQLFHLYSGAHFNAKGLNVQVPGKIASQNMSITQLNTKGILLSSVYNRRTSNPGGLCSEKYGQLLPCYQIQYTQKAANATYVTVIQIGKQNNSLKYNLNKSSLSLKQGDKTYTLNINQKPGQNLSAHASNTKAPKPKENVIDNMANPSNWNVTNANLAVSYDSWEHGQDSLKLTNSPGQTAKMAKKVNLDLSNKDILFRMKISNIQNVDEFNLIVRSNNSSYAEIRLKDAYDFVHDNDQDISGQSATGLTTQYTSWDTLSLSPGLFRTQQGQWSVYGTGFNWSDINEIEFDLSSNAPQTSSVLLGTFSTYTSRQEGKIAVIFDDGSSSILPAVEAMDKYKYKGSVGVIGKYPGTSESGYLSIQDLRNLKNNGWSLINHSYYHQNAITEYYDNNNLEGLKTDVLKGAEFLQQNGLDTDDNWYIYPHGATNASIERVIGKYYMFARTELTAPEAFPFGSPLAVKDFVIEDNTPPQAVEAAIKDANTYHQTLILTFHRIFTDSSDQSGYSLNNFKHVMSYLHQTNSKVMSLNQLDKSNGVPINKITIKQQLPEQIDGSITVKSKSIWFKITHIL
jgi:hypothetical protein